MTFEHAWVLTFLVLPLGWMLFEWRRTRRSLALLLKTLSIIAIILALSEPTLSTPETKMAVAVLVDTSASLSPQDLARASELADAIERSRGRHWIRVLPFARSVRDVAPEEQQHGWHFRYTAGEAGQATDLEAGVREAMASLPPGLVPRLLLISDGKENSGSVLRAAWQAQSLGIPIDTLALKAGRKPTLRLESVSLPTLAFTGEKFPDRPDGFFAGRCLGDRANPRRRQTAGIESRETGTWQQSGSRACQYHRRRRAQSVGFDSRRQSRRDSVRPRHDVAPAQGPVSFRKTPRAPKRHLMQTLARPNSTSTERGDPDARRHDRLPACGPQQSGSGSAAGIAKRRNRELRQARRRPAGDRRRAQHV